MGIEENLPVDLADRVLWCISFALHILLPSILFFFLIRYVQVEAKFRSLLTFNGRKSTDSSNEKLDAITWVRFSNLFLTTAMTFMYLMFYVPIPYAACNFAARFVMGLPFVSRAHNFVFYVLRYINLTKELNGKANITLRNGLLALGLSITFVGWLPFWAISPFLDDFGFCLGVLNPRMIYALGISLLFDFCFGLGLLYMFTVPIENAFKALPSTPKTPSSPPRSPRGESVIAKSATTNSQSLQSVVMRTKWTCYASVTSGLFLTTLLAIVFIWYPTVLWLVFFSDIVSAIDAFINCTSMLYTCKHFNEMLFIKSDRTSMVTNQKVEGQRKDEATGNSVKTSEKV